MSSEPRLGPALELPWWVIALGAPPLLVGVAGVLFGAPLWAHLMIVVASLLTIAAVVTIALRVAGSSMQSVWISALFAVWVFVAIVWGVVVATTPACNCA